MDGYFADPLRSATDIQESSVEAALAMLDNPGDSKKLSAIGGSCLSAGASTQMNMPQRLVVVPSIDGSLVSAYHPREGRCARACDIGHRHVHPLRFWLITSTGNRYRSCLR